MKKQYVLHVPNMCVCVGGCGGVCVCVYLYLSSTKRAWLYLIFPQYLINLSETFLILRRIQRDTVINRYTLSYNFMFVVPYILVTYMFNSSPTRCKLYSLFLSWQRYLYMFQVLFVPIIRSTTAAYSHKYRYNLWMYAAVVLLMMGANSTRNIES
jgi:hypothetical protein